MNRRNWGHTPGEREAAEEMKCHSSLDRQLIFSLTNPEKVRQWLRLTYTKLIIQIYFKSFISPNPKSVVPTKLILSGVDHNVLIVKLLLNPQKSAAAACYGVASSVWFGNNWNWKWEKWTTFTRLRFQVMQVLVSQSHRQKQVINHDPEWRNSQQHMTKHNFIHSFSPTKIQH